MHSSRYARKVVPEIKEKVVPENGAAWLRMSSQGSLEGGGMDQGEGERRDLDRSLSFGLGGSFDKELRDGGGGLSSREHATRTLSPPW